MGIPNTAEKLPSKPADADADVLGAASAPSGGHGTFEGELTGDIDEPFEVVLRDITKTRSANKFKQGEMRDQLVWLFNVVGQEAKGDLPVYTHVNSLHEKSSLPPVIAALGCPPLQDGDPILKSNYIGKFARADIELKTAQSGKKYPKIAKLRPAKKRK